MYYDSQVKIINEPQIICEATQYYSADRDHRNTFRILFRLQDKVEGDLLQQAVQQAIKRHPYYALRCCVNEEQYYLEPHHGPIAVLCTPDPVELGGEASNGYLLSVSYWEDVVWVNFFHGLADGKGAMNFSRTMLYYYCRARYDEQLQAGDIRINGGPIPVEEWENPYIAIMKGERKLPTEEEIAVNIKLNSKQKVLNLYDDPRITVTKPHSFRLRIAEAELMKYCRVQDGTPAVVFSLLLTRAIDKLNPDSDCEIVTGMTVNLRPALEAPHYPGSTITLAYLPYSEKLHNMPFTQQATIYRGRLILAADQERLQADIQNSTRLYRKIYETKSLEGKRQLVRHIIDSYKGASTFQVSYVGPAQLGSVEPYVVETQLQNDGASGAITMEMMASGGSFYLEFVQEWKEELYFQAFCEELTSQGIEFTLLGKGENEVPDIQLPCI